MTSLHQAIADNLILDPETGEWGRPVSQHYRSSQRITEIMTQFLCRDPFYKEQTNHE